MGLTLGGWFRRRVFPSAPSEVKAFALPVLRHRVRLRAEAEMDGVTTDAVLRSVLSAVPAPR